MGYELDTYFIEKAHKTSPRRLYSHTGADWQYRVDFERLRQTFIEYLHHLPFYGLAVLCLDDPEVQQVLPEVTRPVITYGIDAAADVRAGNLRQQGMQTHFTVQRPGSDAELSITLNLPGRHNVLNALAAIAVAGELGVPDSAIQEGLAHFQGIGRRFNVTECTAADGRQLTLVDDYGHHPREVAATLEAARESWAGRRLVLAFQPHRYSRTQEQFEDFVAVLSRADVLVLTEVYAAGEEPLPGGVRRRAR